MSNIATLRPTLVDGIFRRSLTTDAVLVLAGAALTGLAAQVSVPTPIGVPFTLQTFAVLVIGASLGSVRGALSMLAYALLGAIGLGIAATSSSTFQTVSVPGTGDYTLSAAEQNKVLYKFTGLLTGNRNIIVPATIQQYWVDNQTSGAYTLTVKTSGGSGSA
mgnify:CR=1 FL=1